MAVGKFMKSGGIAALAAGLAVLAVPAQAQERGGWGGRGGGNATAQQNNGGNAGTPSWRGNGGGSEGGGGWRGGGNRGFRSEQSGSVPGSAPIEARPQRNWSRSDGNAGATGSSGGWQGRGNGANTDGGNRWNGSRNRPAEQAQAAPVQQQPSQAEAQRRAWNGNGTGQWQGRDRDRDRDRERAAANQNWRNDNNANRWRNDSNSNWRGNDAWRGSSRETWRNNDRQSLSRNWNRDWRRDNRYDWRGWRSSNRDVFRLGAYSAPYRNYSYRRLNSGFYLDTLFFGSRYWINDPWQYRLPPAYGPYRWIRYYDDALLVDTYSGEVVDVIYDFFW